MTRARSGHWPTLVGCFLHFDLSFMLWVLVGSLGVFISQDLGLTHSQKGALVALPLLSGSLLRIPLGWLGDRVGGKRVGLAMLAVLAAPLLVAWQWGDRFSAVVAVGVLLGVGGASFAVALPLASRWYPPGRQGLAMGIAAAGNSGTVVVNLVAPPLAEVVGWQSVFGWALVPLGLVAIAFAILAKEAPRPPAQAAGQGTLPLGAPDLWWLCSFYLVTFGGYVGLSSFLPLLLRDQFGVSPVTAGHLTALAAVAGSAARPIGGMVADRLGGCRVLLIVLAGAAGAYLCASTLPPLPVFVAVVVVAMLALGVGNGAVFQLVPQRFSQHLGAVTGLVGALGGVGGFALPMLLGGLRQRSGSFGPGFVVLGAAALGATIALTSLLVRAERWRHSLRPAQ